MKTVRVAVTGANGQVGRDLQDVLAARIPPGGASSPPPDGRAVGSGEFEVFALARGELDVTDPQRVTSVLAELRPDVVVHLAAYTAVDRAEEEPPACFAVNEHGTAHVAEACRELGAHLVAVSTDYVFDGEKGGPYLEDDVARPINVYGASKRAGELRCGPENTVVRTSWVMGVRGRSVLHTIAERARAGTHVRFVNDQTGTVTTASDLALALAALVRARPGGYWHVANAGATTWFDVAREVGRRLGRNDDFATAIMTSELSPAPLAARPTRSDLGTGKFAGSFGALDPWPVALGRVVEALVAP